jgi:hypothetical protein
VQVKNRDQLLTTPVEKVPTVHSLTVDKTPSAWRAGTFKLALVTSIRPVLFGEADMVCAKQCYMLQEKDVPGHAAESSAQQVARKKKVRVRYEGTRQVSLICTELNCLLWARALTNLAYDHATEVGKRKGPPPFEIPRLRFVETAVAIEANADRASAYMLEEVIPMTEPEPWVKYINNDTPRLVLGCTASPLTIERGKFLIYAQHVQFWKSKRQVYVSDYQGQRMTSLKIKAVRTADLLRRCRRILDGSSGHDEWVSPG